MPVSRENQILEKRERKDTKVRNRLKKNGVEKCQNIQIHCCEQDEVTVSYTRDNEFSGQKRKQKPRNPKNRVGHGSKR